MRRFTARFFTSLALAMALIGAGTGSALAAPVSEDQARLVADNYLRHVVNTFNRWEGHIPTIRAITPIHYGDTKVFWHVQLEPSGFLLVSSRDELSPVKVYSERGVFDPARVTTPSAPESWIIPEQYLSVEAVSNPAKRAGLTLDSTVTEQIDLAWRIFGQTGPDSIRLAQGLRSAQVGPLVSALWDQGDPYNRQTPTVDGEHTLVGCVSTAWSMLLRHWQWPDWGEGVKTHTWAGQTFEVDFSQTAWNWSLMPDQLTANSSLAAIAAVSALNFQVGVAAEMNWGLHESGSNLYADEVFSVYFKYKDAMEQVERHSMNAEQWFNAFRNEFDASPARPIVMSIFDDVGGHEILADGYQTGATNKVHLNMGWSGFANTWYDVTSDFATGGYTWNGMYSVIVVGIEPSYPVQCESGMVTLTDPITNGAHTWMSERSIQVAGTVSVADGARLQLTAPRIDFARGFAVVAGGQLSAMSASVTCPLVASAPNATIQPATASVGRDQIEAPSAPLAPGLVTHPQALPLWLQDRLARLGLDTDPGVLTSTLLDANEHWIILETTQSLLASDRNQGASDIYRLDLLTERLELISVTDSGLAGNGPSRDPTADANGERIVFASEASDLVPGDDNGVSDLFLRDLALGHTERLTQTDQTSAHPALDAHGSALVYDQTTEAGPRQILGQALTQGAAADIVLLSDMAMMDASRPALSADGRYLAYLSHSGADCTLVLRDFEQPRSHRQPCPGTVAEEDAARVTFSAEGHALLWHSSGQAQLLLLPNPLAEPQP